MKRSPARTFTLVAVTLAGSMILVMACGSDAEPPGVTGAPGGSSRADAADSSDGFSTSGSSGTEVTGTCPGSSSVRKYTATTTELHLFVEQPVVSREPDIYEHVYVKR